MPNSKALEWALRVGVAGEFIGHGVFALQGKEGWFKYFNAVGINDVGTITTLLFLVGILDVIVALIVLLRPIRAVVLWAALWGLWTALIRWPVGPDPAWDFFERWANWAAPLALFYMMGGRLRAVRSWFK